MTNATNRYSGRSEESFSLHRFEIDQAGSTQWKATAIIKIRCNDLANALNEIELEGSTI
jgi:hypothetical protein